MVSGVLLAAQRRQLALQLLHLPLRAFPGQASFRRGFQRLFCLVQLLIELGLEANRLLSCLARLPLLLGLVYLCLGLDVGLCLLPQRQYEGLGFLCCGPTISAPFRLLYGDVLWLCQRLLIEVFKGIVTDAGKPVGSAAPSL